MEFSTGWCFLHEKFGPLFKLRFLLPSTALENSWHAYWNAALSYQTCIRLKEVWDFPLIAARKVAFVKKTLWNVALACNNVPFFLKVRFILLHVLATTVPFCMNAVLQNTYFSPKITPVVVTSFVGISSKIYAMNPFGIVSSEEKVFRKVR